MNPPDWLLDLLLKASVAVPYVIGACVALVIGIAATPWWMPEDK